MAPFGHVRITTSVNPINTKLLLGLLEYIRVARGIPWFFRVPEVFMADVSIENKIV